MNSLNIIEKVAAADPANAQRQRERGVAYEKIGDVLLATGHNEEALKAYRTSLEIREKLAAEDESNTEWLRDVAFTREKTAKALLALGQNDEGFALYRKAIATREKLVAGDAKNIDWVGELAASYVDLGDALANAGQGETAIDAYRQSLAAIEKSGGTSGNRPVPILEVAAYAHERLGDALIKASQKAEAIASYQESLHLRDILVIVDPKQTAWRKNLFITLVKLGDAGDDSAARYSRALTIVRALDAEGALAAEEKGWIELVEKRIAALPPEQANNQPASAQ